MPTIDKIVSHVLLLLDNRTSLDEFGDWMLMYTANIMRNNATRELAYAIESDMTSFDTGRLDEDSLRQKLRKAIEPFSS
jgi:hypothetical protein